MLAAAVMLGAVLPLGVPSPGLLHDASLGVFAPRGRAPDLSLHAARLGVRPPGASLGLAAVAGLGGGGDPPVCSGDVCQPAVALPGQEPVYDDTRELLFLRLLAKVDAGPLTSLVWAFVSTGLQIDYRPPVWNTGNEGPRGWGSFMIRVRFRILADNTPVFPGRPRP